MRLIIFENEEVARNLYPLPYLRPMFELRCGQTLLREKIERDAGREVDGVFVRDEIAAAYAARTGRKTNDASLLEGDDLLLVNARLLLIGETALPTEGESAAHAGGDIAWVRVSKETAAKLDKSSVAAFVKAAAEAVTRRDVEAEMISWPWEFALINGEAIRDDFAKLPTKGVAPGTMADQAAIWGPEDLVAIAPGATIEPFVCLDTTDGPIIIEEGVRVNPFTRIEGPASIGRKSVLFGAKIREGSTIGPVCRVGGEIEEAIMHAHSNKYHDGFLGHAYVCEWVNLGALTTNSDLKNDYGAVEVYVHGQLMDTGSTKVGCCIGDHTKTSIGTLINTGTMVGMMSNIVGAGSILPKVTPSFVLYAQGRFFRQGMKTLLATAKTAMGRRDMEMLREEEELIKYCMELTREERNKAIKKSR